MSQLYVPDKVWLVCTEGMTKRQLKVTSQNTIKIADGRLAATINDRFDGNFMCAKMVIAGAVIGSIASAIFVAATIATGGAVAVGTAMAIGAGAATAGSIVGGLTAMMPSICSMLCGGSQWNPVHPKVLLQKQPALIESSKINCFLGGNVMIFYSEIAATKFTDLVMKNSLVKVGGIILGSAALSASIATVMTAGASFWKNIKVVYNDFGKKATFIFLRNNSVYLGTGYLTSKISEYGKENIYQLIQEKTGFKIDDYAKGKTVEIINEKINTKEDNIIQKKKILEADIPADDIDETLEAPNITSYKEIEYERKTVITGENGVEEYEIEKVSNRNERAIREKNPHTTTISSNERFGDTTGAYYNNETYTYTEGRQMNVNIDMDIGTTIKDTIKGIIDVDMEEIYTILMNKLLEIPLQEYEKAIEKENDTKKTINIIANEI